MGNATNIFTQQKATKRGKRNKIIIVAAAVILAAFLLWFFIVVFPALLPKEEPEAVATAPVAAVAERVDDMKIETNNTLSPEQADDYIAETERLLADTHLPFYALLQHENYNE